MSGIDWQAYLDGSMPYAERQIVKQRLNAEPDIQSEWEAFQAFRDQVRDAMCAEPIPHNVLEARLQAVAAKGRPRIAARPLGGLVAAGVVMTALLFWGRSQETFTPVAPAPRAETERTMPFTDPEAARKWALQSAGFDAPANLADTAQLFSVSTTSHTIAYRYRVGRQLYSVVVCRSGEIADPREAKVQTAGNTFFKCNRSVLFRKNGLAYRVEGPSSEIDMDLAIKASSRCSAKAPAPIQDAERCTHGH